MLTLLPRFYSDAVLGHLHRSIAIQEWVRLGDGDSVSLERALAAFDMFVLHERKGDFTEVCYFKIEKHSCGKSLKKTGSHNPRSDHRTNTQKKFDFRQRIATPTSHSTFDLLAGKQSSGSGQRCQLSQSPE